MSGTCQRSNGIVYEFQESQKEQMNIGSEDVKESLFGLEDEDFGEKINSRMNVTNISSGGSNRGRSGGRMFSTKKKNQDKKVLWIIFSLLMQRWLFKIEGVER